LVFRDARTTAAREPVALADLSGKLVSQTTVPASHAKYQFLGQSQSLSMAGYGHEKEQWKKRRQPPNLDTLVRSGNRREQEKVNSYKSLGSW
jgi:hypothetical protein